MMVGILSSQLLEHGRHVCGCGLHGYAISEPRDRFQTATPPDPPTRLRSSDRCPELGVLCHGKVKVRGQHANHDMRLCVAKPERLERDGLAEDIGFAAETSSPRGIRDHNGWRCSDALLIWGEVTPDQWCHTQRAEERTRHPESWHTFRPDPGFKREA